MVKVMGMRESWILNSSQRLIFNLKVDPTLPSPCSESHLSFRGGCSFPDEAILPTVSEDCFAPLGFTPAGLACGVRNDKIALPYG